MRYLKAENKKLSTEVPLLKSKNKENDSKLEKMEKVLKEHHTMLTRSDKDTRAKRLILAGIPEKEVTINGVKTTDDAEKGKQIVIILNTNDIAVLKVRRIGKKDQGVDDRPRYLLLEFSSSKIVISLQRRVQNCKVEMLGNYSS